MGTPDLTAFETPGTTTDKTMSSDMATPGSASQPSQVSQTPGVDAGNPIQTSNNKGAYGGVDPNKWAHDFLTALGKPTTAQNVRAIVAWQQAESGGGGGAFNPLNTTQGGFTGETNLNSVGVKNYQSYQDGIDANVKVINNGYYGPILAALDQGNNAMAVAQAVTQTPWGTGAGVERVLSG
jgi:hypothetical protein